MPDFNVKVPTIFYDRCVETHEDQFWMDDRGFTYGIVWSEDHQKPLAACVDVPYGHSSADAWHRNTPQPDYVEQ